MIYCLLIPLLQLHSYQMTAVRQVIKQLVTPRSTRDVEIVLTLILNKTKSLKIQQLQEMFREISHLVDQREDDANNQLLVLKMVKQLIITGSYSVYLFSNVYIFPWVLSICNFHKQKSIETRAALLHKESSAHGAVNSNAGVDSFKMFLNYAEEFLVFFGDNLKFYPYSKYKIPNIFAKELENQSFKKSLSQFTKGDLSNLNSNLKKKGQSFRDDLREFTDFLSSKIEECFQNSSKIHENLFLLTSLVEISESFCINLIAFRLCSFLSPNYITEACKIIDFIISTAEIEAIQEINFRCLPTILEYLLPVDFKEQKVLQAPKVILEGNTLNKIVDYFYVWFEKTKILKLSTKIYENSVGLVQYLKKRFKLSYEQQLREFHSNLQKIQQNNEIKRPFITGQHKQQEQNVVRLLKEVAFCINSQNVQRKVAYQNILDDQTISEKEVISEFGQSLLKSARQREASQMLSKNSNSFSLRKFDNSSRISKSGQFLYFEKESQFKSQKNIEEQQNNQNVSRGQIQFTDSLKGINSSQSCEILDFGMDANAKVPQTISKPKFKFKSIETNDQSAILKDIQTPRTDDIFNMKSQAKKDKDTLKNATSQSQTIVNQFKQTRFQTKNNFSSKVSKIKSVDSKFISSPRPIIPQATIPEDYSHRDQYSESIIKNNSGQIQFNSASISLSSQKIPSKFGSVFKQKSEKASVISSSRSLKKFRQIPERQIEIPDFKKLRDLQNELGKLKKETQIYNKQLEQKNEEMQRLKAQRKEIIQSDPYFLRKENEIMKILLKNKEKAHPTKIAQDSGKILTKELKESSIKNFNLSLKDYNSQALKLKFSNIKGYTKQQRKNIISNRCILLKNKLIQIGYSFKNNEVTLYLTLKNYCDSLDINLTQNSINFSETIRRSFDKLYVGKQMKFKTQVNQTKENEVFVPAVVTIQLTYQHKLQSKVQRYECQFPLTPYNMAIPLAESQGASYLSQGKDGRTVYITPLYNFSEEYIKKGKVYLMSLFPHGFFDEDRNMFTINYRWKGHIETINIKLKQRAFRIEGTGHPTESGRELIQTIINLLIDKA